MDMIINKIYHNLERLPYQYQTQVLDFVEYLTFKNEQKSVSKKTEDCPRQSNDAGHRLAQEMPAYNHLPALQTRRSILELRGLGKHVWQNVSVKDYINAERDSWNG